MDLPPELLQIIFSFCSVSDLLESVQHVCQDWRESVFSPLVWKNKTLQISGDEDYLIQLESLLEQMPFLKNVLFEDVSWEGLAILCENCQSLRNLQIICGDGNPRALVSLSPALTCLTHIDVNFQRSFKLEVAFQDYHCDFPPLLRKVIFRMCTTDGTIPLVILETCNFLEHLIVSLGYEVESIVKSSLDDTSLSERTPGKHNVRTIYLCGAIFEDKNILMCISQFPNVGYLALKHNLFHDDDILNTIFKEPRPDLVFLDLSYSFKLSPEALVSVINACPNLRFLSLMRSYVCDNTLSCVINNLHKLQCLNLHGTPISSQEFLTIPENLPNLTDLNLCACRRIDLQILTVLVNLMPNLVIVHPRRGLVKGACAAGRQLPFLEQRNFMAH